MNKLIPTVTPGPWPVVDRTGDTLMPQVHQVLASLGFGDAIGNQVVSAMVAGANTAIARIEARTSMLDKVDEMLRGVDEALARLSVAPASQSHEGDICVRGGQDLAESQS